MKFSELKKVANLNWNKVIAIPDGGSTLNFEFDIEPEDFLQFAETDLIAGKTHNLVNALSNSKRAIHCAVDKIINIFDLKATSNYKTFPTKVKLLQEIGIITPRILSKVNKNRNFLEHDYKKPSKASVEDALDIANLFVMAVRGSLRALDTEFFIQEGYEEKETLTGAIYFSFDDKKKNFKVTLYQKGKDLKITVGPDDKEYRSIIKVMLSFEINPRKQEEGLKELSGKL